MIVHNDHGQQVGRIDECEHFSGEPGWLATAIVGASSPSETQVEIGKFLDKELAVRALKAE